MSTQQLSATVASSVGSMRGARALQGAGGTARIAGLDVARGLAVIGMMGAHLDLSEDLSWSPSSWQGLVYGRSAALFAMLAGVSIALLSGGARPVSGGALVRARGRIMVRAAWVFLIGGLLELLGAPVDVILGVYAILFVLAVPFLRWAPRRLLLLAAVLAVLAPPASLLLSQVAVAADDEGAFASLVLTGSYPAIWWVVFVLVGLAVGRLHLTSRGVRLRLLLAGTAAAVVGYALGWLSTQLLANGVAYPEPGDAYDRMPGWDEETVGQWDWAWLSGAQPHTGTTFWLLASAGFAVAVIAACLLAADALPRLSYPIASVGAMALTVYSLHIVVLTFFPPDGTYGVTIWLLYIVGAMAFAVTWRTVAGRGPVERILTWSSHRATTDLP
jgi:uncharacterized membrane protein YeiB